MEAILYDYHFAENIPTHEKNADITREAYLQAVLNKHHVTRPQFERALQYYSRNTKKFLEIYQHLEERYNKEFTAIGGNVQQNMSRQYAETGDTADVWKDRRMVMLFPKKPYNFWSFEVPVDTSFHTGDRISFYFYNTIIPNEINRNTFAVLTVTFGNDSTGVMQTQMQSNNRFQLSIQDYKHLGIKRIRGYFLMNESENGESMQTLKTVVIDRIQLVRIHNKPNASTGPTPVQMSPDAPPLPPPTEMVEQQPVHDVSAAKSVEATPTTPASNIIGKNGLIPRGNVKAKPVTKRKVMTAADRQRRADSLKRVQEQNAKSLPPTMLRK